MFQLRALPSGKIFSNLEKTLEKQTGTVLCVTCFTGLMHQPIVSCSGSSTGR